MTEKGESTQPSLLNLPEVRKDTTDFLRPDGKKRNNISTGMKREEINKLGRGNEKKRRRRTGNPNWPNEY